ncbi:MAG: tRNA 4-thiouridine(8) synthase ThiI [Candidatus Parcubacteria bacterium]|nr:tRNA 4-thiouridine(8) synthase ThiI [Candidatus Parcubacteria bacterium]
MLRYIIIHYGEIALKGRNRQFFEKKLADNIKFALKEFGKISLFDLHGRFIVLIEENWDLDKVTEKLLKVFGIEYFAMAWNSALDLDQLSQDLLSLLKDKKFKTFRITTRRANKNFALTSQQVSAKLGELVLETMKKKVDLHKPDLNCRIDIVNNFVFIYFDKIICRGGLPIGVSDKLLCLISGGIDSPVAANLMQKRGAKIIFINFDSYPATPKENQEKVKDLVKVLAEYQHGCRLYLVPFLKIQQEIINKVPPAYRVIFYRRMMLRIASLIAQKENVLALVTGDSLGQVASQTVENIHAISEAIDLPILRPLIGFNKEEIVTIARQIGTYELSSQPFADCCSLYVPQHPVTRSDLNLILDTEKDWKFEELLDKAMGNCEIIEINN